MGSASVNEESVEENPIGIGESITLTQQTIDEKPVQ